MVDFFGGLPYHLPNDRVIGGDTILKGEQLLDGRRVASLLLSKNNNSLYDYKLQSELITKLIKNSFHDKLAEQYEQFVRAIFYNTETNLNQYDFAKRQTGFLNRLKLNSIVTTELIVVGEYNNDFTAFYPDEESIKKVTALFE